MAAAEAGSAPRRQRPSASAASSSTRSAAVNAAQRCGPMSTSVGLSAAGDAPSTGGGYACACVDLRGAARGGQTGLG